MRHSLNKPDANQAEIDEALRGLGCVVISMRGDPGIGFDSLVAVAGHLFAVEVKDGSKSPSKRRLTNAEQARKDDLNRAGAPYIVFESVDDAVNFVKWVRRENMKIRITSARAVPFRFVADDD